MYQLLLSNAPQSSQGAQSVVDAFMAMLGLSFLLSILLPILIILFFLTILILLGMLTQSIAGKKGYNRFGFFWYGFFFFPIAVGVAILAPPKPREGYSRQSSAEQDKEELAKYAEMYEAGTLSWTQFCQKKEEILQREYRK